MSVFWGPAGPPFVLFGAQHLAALAVVLLVNLSFIRWRRTATEAGRRRFRLGLAALLLVDEAILHLWYISNGVWSVQTMLPFHLCAVLVYVSAAMLVTRSYRLYEVCYFLGLGAATQALLTPDTPFGFPHWRFFSVFLSHGCMVTAAVYMTVVEGCRPTWRSLGRTLLALLIYAVPVYFINRLLGSNYLFIMRKPDTASLMDALPAWPWYLPIVAALALIVFTLLYLPFAIRDGRQGQAAPAPAEG